MSAPVALGREVALLTNSGRLGIEPYTAVVDRVPKLRVTRELWPSAVEAQLWIERQARGTGKVIASARAIAIGIGRSVRTAKHAIRQLVEHGIIQRHRRFYLDPTTGLMRDGAALIVLVGATRRYSAAVKRAAAAVRAVVDNPPPRPVQPDPPMCAALVTPRPTDEDLPPENRPVDDVRSRVADLRALIQRRPNARDEAVEAVRARDRVRPG